MTTKSRWNDINFLKDVQRRQVAGESIKDIAKKEGLVTSGYYSALNRHGMKTVNKPTYGKAAVTAKKQPTLITPEKKTRRPKHIEIQLQPKQSGIRVVMITGSTEEISDLLGALWK